jgi:aspartate-semialdehyde dehydrogenase
VPTFAGQGATLSIETERPIAADHAARVLAGTPGLDVRREGPAPGTRDAVGREEVIVGRLRADETAAPGHGLLVWLTADPVRLGASNAVRLLRARFPTL